MKIDSHCHAFPLNGLLAMREYYPDLIEVNCDEQGNEFAVWAKTPLPVWNAQRRIDKMDQAGIDIEIIQNPIIYHRIDEKSPPLCRTVNDSLAEVYRAHPDRFRFLASLPLNDMNEAVRIVCLRNI